jgi:ABC-type uncharacterized transport system substrate-binding protein
VRLTGTRLVTAVALLFLAVPLAAQVQQARKVSRIGWLNVSSVATNAAVTSFREGLRELGWVEGRDVVIEYRSAEGRVERLPALAADLVRLKVDVIVAGGASAPLEASKATATIPIVMTSGGDPARRRALESGQSRPRAGAESSRGRRPHARTRAPTTGVSRS